MYFVYLLCIVSIFTITSSNDLFSSNTNFNNNNNLFKCDAITSSRLCSSMPWNMTTYPNLLGHSKQDDADSDMAVYLPLLNINCSKVLRYFLCSVYTPICSVIVGAVKPCRNLCEEARLGCERVMMQFGFNWPPLLRCDQYPNDQPCFEAPKDGQIINKKSIQQSKQQFQRGSKDDLEDFLCPYQFRVYNTEFKYTLKFNSHLHVENCGMPCKQMLFNMDNQERIKTFRYYVGILAILCMISTSFTIFTYLIDMKRFSYPERPILFLSICYFLLSIAYLIGFIDYFFDSTISCNQDDLSTIGGQQSLTDSTTVGKDTISVDSSRGVRLLVQGTQNKWCILTFLLIYFFGMASMIWWVILTLTWFMAAGLKWGHEAIEAQSVYFHLASWAIPTVMSAALLLKKSIDGDYLTGVCYTGLTDLYVQRGFLLVPNCIFIFVGLCFLLSGFISVFKIRNVMKYEGTKTDKLEKFMIRIGLFSVIYILPQLIIIACLLYEQINYNDWLRWWKKKLCDANESNYISYLTCSSISTPAATAAIRTGPRYEIFMLKYTCMLIVGITFGPWIMSHKTLQAWKKFYMSFCGGRRGSELL